MYAMPQTSRLARVIKARNKIPSTGWRPNRSTELPYVMRALSLKTTRDKRGLNGG